jgi:hypothetical protein
LEAELNSTFWRDDVVAAVVSAPGGLAHDKYAKRLKDGYEFQHIHIDSGLAWHDWLDWLEGYAAWFKIEAFTEFQHASLVVAALGLEGGGDSVFTVLETRSLGHSDSSQRAICIEKSGNKLEIAVGRKNDPVSVLFDFMQNFRATGDSRGVRPWSPLTQGTRCEVGRAVGMPEMTLLDLFRWINGPLAENWKPFNPVSANSHHFAHDLHNFLKKGCPENEANDRELVMHAVTEDGANLQHASEALRCDLEIVLAAVGQDPDALQYAASDLQKSKEVVLAAIAGNGMALRFADKELQDDQDVVAYALRQNGRAFLFASKRLQADRHLALLAIEQDLFALQFTSEHLRADRDIMMQAIAINGTALRYASEELRADRALVRDAVLMDGRALRVAAEDLQTDEELMDLAEPGDYRAHGKGKKRYKPALVKLSEEEIGVTKMQSDEEAMMFSHERSTAEIMKNRPWKQFYDEPHELVFQREANVDYTYNF